MDEIRFNDLTFDPALLTARRDDGSALRFTRKERALLAKLIEKPGMLRTRGHLLASLDDSVDVGERNVDFLVTRLRAKLGCSAREPRFIATQYGEGYVWIAKPDSGHMLDAFLVIGPVYGLAQPDGAEHAALAMLTRELDSAMGQETRVACEPHWRPHAARPHATRYTLEASWHRLDSALHAALVLRHGPSAQVIKTFRATFAATPQSAAIGALAASIRETIWAHVAVPASTNFVPTDTPLEVRIHDASVMLTRTAESWHESESQIEKARAAAPGDPALAVMRGLSLYARLVQQTGEGKRPSPQEWTETEDQIEALALGCLPAAQDNPLLVLGVAKLLFFVERGHFELAERLADEAFERSTAFAAAFAMQGQLRMCRGSLDEALALYDKGIELSKPGSEFHVYLLILKCTALLAADDRAGLDATCAVLYAAKPIVRLQLGLVMAPPNARSLPSDLEAVLAGIGKAHAQSQLTYFYQVSARHFRSARHRLNVMRGMLAHLRRRFGHDVLPEDIARALASID